MPGPVPKRSEERIRRNKPDVEITTIAAHGVVEQPELELDDPHPIVQDMWDALGGSAQASFYEPSDWQYLRFTLHFADLLLKQKRPGAQMLATVNAAFGDLLVSEGSRRRVRLEVERQKTKAEVVDLAKVLRERLTEPPEQHNQDCR